MPLRVRQSWGRMGRVIGVEQRECAARPFTLPTNCPAASTTAFILWGGLLSMHSA